MDSIDQKPRSLIMCATPLQMLIAEKIIELNSNESFDLLVLVLNDNKKYRTYFQRIESYCVNSLYYVVEKGRLSFLDFIGKLNKYSLNGKYNNYYLSNIHSRYFQYILSKSRYPNVFTFDDGTANIIASSKFHLNSKPRFLKRAIWRLLGVRYYMEDIKKHSSLHYTIYKDIPNIIENTEYIPLINKGNSNNREGSKVVRFYLGQPISDISKVFDISFVEGSINKLEIDYYYPHPREKVFPKGDFQLIESLLIFEDYIVQFLRDNINTNVELFSFTSSALLNVISLDGVKASYIHDKQMFKLHSNFYKLAQESFGIPHLDLDD